MWSSSSALGGILSGPSDLVGLSVLSSPKRAAGVMTTSVKHTPSELFAQFIAGILSNVSVFKTEDKNIFHACDLCSSVSAVLPFSNTSLLMPFFTFNNVFTYFQIYSGSVLHFFCNIYMSYCFLNFLFSELAMFLVDHKCATLIINKKQLII